MARALQRRPQLLQQQAEVLGLGQAEAVNCLRCEVGDLLPVGIDKQGGEIHGLGAVGDAFFPHGEQVAAPYQLVDGPDADRRHALPQFLCNKAHEVHHIFRLSGKACSQLRVLGRDPHRAGVQVADPHHAAAQGNEGCCRKAEFLRAEHTGHRHIPPGHELSVRLDHDLLPQAVLDQGLVCLGDAQLPGEAGVMDGGPRRGAGSAVVAGDQDHLSPRFRDAAGDGSHARFRDQLDADAGVPVGVFQVENQLCQILDGINIMMGRRTHQRDARRGAAGSCDPRIDLASRQVPAFSGFRALRHLDLQFLRAVEIRAGHAEAPRGDLLDGRTVQRVLQAVRGLSALTGVGAAAEAVHCLGQAFMGFLRNGAVAHGAGFEASDDALHRLDLVQRDAAVRIPFEVQQAAKGMRDLQIVHHGGILLERLIASLSRRLLQQFDGQGVIHVVLRAVAGAQLVRADGIERGIDAEAQRFKGLIVLPFDPFADLLQADALHAADGVGEVPVDHPGADADALKDLRRLVGLDRGDSHLGGDLYNAREDPPVIVVDGRAGVLVQHVQAHQFLDAFLRQIGVDGLGAVTQQRCEMMHRARFRALEDERQGRALLAAHQVFLYG